MHRMKALFRSWLHTIFSWNIHIGRNPACLPPRSIVLFPCRQTILCCGLAGILVIKGAKKAALSEDQALLSGYWEKIRTRHLGAVLDAALSSQDYLAPDSLAGFDRELYALKQSPARLWALTRGASLAMLGGLSHEMASFAQQEEALLEEKAASFSTRDLEILTRSLIAFKDISWALQQDVLENVDRIQSLAGKRGEISALAFEKYLRLNRTLNALDRLEVRGRDSCGLQAAFGFADAALLDRINEALEDAGLREDFTQRCMAGDTRHLGISLGTDSIIFTYKTARATGDLGDNTSSLRYAIQNDAVLGIIMEHVPQSQMYLAHTRWASVGAISEANCHPVNAFSVAPDTGVAAADGALKNYPFYGIGPWSINVALNGDIDNYPGLKQGLAERGCLIDSRVTTDTKIIPLMIERYLLEGHDVKEAFRKALCDFDGSHAIAMQSNLEPGRVYLAQRGSGQSIYVGLCDNQYLFSSEIYGLVEETPLFIKMDGEKERIPGDVRTRGQIVMLRDDAGSGLKGIEAMYYDGFPLELGEHDIQRAEITTRDIERGDSPHYFLKEIMEAPQSVRKTMRGRYRVTESNEIVFNLDENVVPAKIRDALTAGTITRMYVIGQGTAAIAGGATAEALSVYMRGTPISVQAIKATDLSGFCLEEDMSHCLVIAITQSGTTTDTNRAVSMARERGAWLIAIVNRRQSDITTKVDGVFYTSDGRDIEMSVASTKAFYSQITAGFILAMFMARLLNTLSREGMYREIMQLEQAPELMRQVFAARDAIRDSAWKLACTKKYWAIVGSGANKVASDEIRIKLSELCYRTISTDVIEDKKHIDLSAEPLILVCAAGSPEVVQEDIVKDVAIFHAHASSVVVIADEGEKRFEGIARDVLHVPASAFPVSVILNTLAGHLWGYFAACSLDEQAAAFKSFRANLTELMRSQDSRNFSVYETISDPDLHRLVNEFSAVFHGWRRSARLASMHVETATDITLLLKYAVGKLPVEDFWSEPGDNRTGVSPLGELDSCLARAIDELSRPVDAIRHQAKTVTVGTSRKVEAPHGPIFDLIEEMSFTVANIPAKDGMVLKRLQEAIACIKGSTLYAVKGLDAQGQPGEHSTIKAIRKTGVAENMTSRFDRTGPLKGTKNTIVRTGYVYAGQGKSDNAPIIIVPLLNASRAVEHLLLLHVDYRADIDVDHKKEILGEKYSDIRNLIDEYNADWDERYIAELPIGVLLGEDVETIKNLIFERFGTGGRTD
jgi:glucosamine--fructose-6-phosphate aminotransferase (isomerizing)